RVPGLCKDFLGFDNLVNFRLGGIGLGIHDINSGGADPGNYEVAPLDEGVPRERRQSRRASVPAEMVKLVTLVGHRNRMDDLAERWGARLYVDHGKRVGF